MNDRSISARLLGQPSFAIPVLLLVFLAALPSVAHALDEAFYIAFFARIVVYALAAMALNLALGYGGLVSFGHALFLGLGAYSVALPAFHGVGNGWAHVAICLVGCGLAAAVTGLISLRTSGIAFIMITLAFAQMGYFMFVSLKQYGGDDGLSITMLSQFGGVDLGSAERVYYAAYVLLVLAIWWMARLRVSPFGMALRGARQNARRVSASGLPVRQYQLAAYVLSGMLCGLAGLLLANLNAFASPSSMSWTVSGELIVMVVLGGMGSVFGPLLGAFVFIGMEEVLKGITAHWMVVFGPLIVLVALVGRKGVMGLLVSADGLLARRSKNTAVPGAADSREAGTGAPKPLGGV